jgi:hypothetical protein
MAVRNCGACSVLATSEPPSPEIPYLVAIAEIEAMGVAREIEHLCDFHRAAYRRLVPLVNAARSAAIALQCEREGCAFAREEGSARCVEHRQ